MTIYNFDRTNRGFRIIEFRDLYKQPCSIQESSLATEACVWVGQDGEHRMHLTQDDARKIADILNYFADIGELPEHIEDL